MNDYCGKKPRLIITYCTKCQWLLRAAWIAQELLTTFSEELEEVTLQPGTKGVFEIRINNDLIFSLKQAGRFPEIKEIKRCVRDLIVQYPCTGDVNRQHLG